MDRGRALCHARLPESMQPSNCVLKSGMRYTIFAGNEHRIITVCLGPHITTALISSQPTFQIFHATALGDSYTTPNAHRRIKKQLERQHFISNPATLHQTCAPDGET